MKLSIIIPIFNEAPTIRELLELVDGQAVPVEQRELILVESNSTDGTREIVKKFVAEFPSTGEREIKLILQADPKGKGNAVREGLAQATGDIVLIQDGDLEYDTRDYPSLLQPILDGRTSFVLGSRHLAAGSWKIRKFENEKFKSIILNLGGTFFHGFFNLLYQQRLTDPTTMYKVFRRGCLEKLHFVSNRFDFDFELVAKLIRAGYKPLEVAVSYRSRQFEEGKKVRMFRDPLTWIRAILRFRFSPL